MKPSLVDVNVWLALLVLQHEHHALAVSWFESLPPAGAGLCRFVQLGLMRLLANPAVMANHAIAAFESWQAIGTLLEDERVEFIQEPQSLDSILPPLLRYQIPTGKLIGDAYLAAFAMRAGLRMVTLDRGFRQFEGLNVHLLNG